MNSLCNEMPENGVFQAPSRSVVAGPGKSSGTVAEAVRPLVVAIAAVDAGLMWASERFFTWRRRMLDRRALQGLDEHMLHDIGLSRADVEQEASKPFWRA